ncbi:divergent protein kinase domain 2A-like [Corticium candelabrum]|uniref:divergent protein kinase domain 2A-like n=1 Tax=Corticium candelabrum TaxID=121492 RepID=UPI002E2546EE|nr:divergent protein kinase domain 2A-like [Corticium candelabrum]
MRKVNRRVLLLCLGLTLALLFVIRHISILFPRQRLADESFFLTSTCPACFGDNLCKQLEDRLLVTSFLLTLRASFKGVHRAEWSSLSKGSVRVVTKSLSLATEMKEFDAQLCLYTTGDRYCSVDEAAKLLLSSNVVDRARKGSNTMWDRQLDLSDHFGCVSKRLETKVIRLYDKNGDGLLSVEEHHILATTLKVNREPIILQLFPNEDGWPFPRYYGACGRTIIVEDGGRPLLEYMNKPWEFRVWLAVQLLQIAFLLTNNNKEWAVYLTDIDLENFALSRNGQVLAIDVEHVEVVDMREIKQKGLPIYRNFKAENPFCDHDNVICGTHSIDAMCRGQERDHNFIYTCRAMLGFPHHGRLLSNPPSHVKDRIESLLMDCIYYNSDRPRWQAAEELLQFLVSLLPNGPDQDDLMQIYNK